MARRKILVMDDDPELLQTAAALLAARFDVVTYPASFNRLNAVHEHQPDLVLMDVNMPLIPGDEVTRLLRDNGDLGKIPVLLFSSNDERSLKKMAAECGAVGYLSKSEMGGSFAAKVERRLQDINRAR